MLNYSSVQMAVGRMIEQREQMFQTKLRSISTLVNSGDRFSAVKDFKFNEFEAYSAMKNAHVVDNLDEFET